MWPLIRAALYLAVSGLFGSALLLASSREGRLAHSQRLWLLGCAFCCAGLSLVGLWLQVAEMNGAPATGPLVWIVVRDMPVGRAAVIRVVAALGAALLVGRGGALSPLRLRWTAGLGAVAAASLAWSGHGAAGEGIAGAAALGADLIHLLAAGFWIGAIAGLALQAAAARADEPASVAALRRAMAEFSGPGTAAVVLLTATGLVNAWRLIGPEHAAALYADPYGRLLSLKLALFAAMLALAAANRWRHVAALGPSAGSASGSGRASLKAARLSLWLEFAAGVGVLIAVGWMGTLPPPNG